MSIFFVRKDVKKIGRFSAEHSFPKQSFVPFGQLRYNPLRSPPPTCKNLTFISALPVGSGRVVTAERAQDGALDALVDVLAGPGGSGGEPRRARALEPTLPVGARPVAADLAVALAALVEVNARLATHWVQDVSLGTLAPAFEIVGNI